MNFSDFYSNSLSYKWQPPADFSYHFPEATTFFESSNFYTSIGWELKTKNIIFKILLVRVNSALTSSLAIEGIMMNGPYVG